MEAKQPTLRVVSGEGMNPPPPVPSNKLLKSINLVQNRTETSGLNATTVAKPEVS